MSYGAVSGISAYWPNPSQILTIANLDSSVVQQYLTGQSADHTKLIGYTLDTTSLEGPGRGFVYDVASKQFHLLAVTVASSTQLVVVPTAISSTGTVTGYVAYVSSLKGAVHQQFTYDLATDTFQVTDPTTPSNIGQFTTYTSSPNGLFLGGQDSSAYYPEIYSLSSNALTAIDRLDAGARVVYVSNDGSIAVIATPGDNLHNISIDAKLWIPGTGRTSMIQELVALNFGNWLQPSMNIASPSGRYLAMQAMQGSTIGQFLVHVK